MPDIPIVQIFLALISFIFILKFGKEWHFFEKIKNGKQILSLTLFLIILLTINNYLIISYDTIVPWKKKYLQNPVLPILVSYILSSTSEEIVYRGFVQNYINNKIGTRKNRIISSGNWVATSIMTLIHVRFFIYFNLTFAITSIVLVNFTHYFVCLGVLKIIYESIKKESTTL